MKQAQKYGGLLVIVLLLVMENVIPGASAQTRGQQEFNGAKGAITGVGVMAAVGAGACTVLTAGGCGAIVASGVILGAIGGTLGAMGTPQDYSLPPASPADMPDWDDPVGEMRSVGGPEGINVENMWYMLPW